MKNFSLALVAIGLSFGVGACSRHGSSSAGQTEPKAASIRQALTAADFHELRPTGDPHGPANFGWSVATDGKRVLVGANRVAGSVGSEGAAYVFERQPGGGFAQQARFTSQLLPAQAAQFGYAVALSGDVALIGAPFLNRAGVANPGAAYLFRRASDGTWPQLAELVGAAQPNAYFGYSVALSGKQAFVGAWGYNRAYVFEAGADGSYASKTVLSPASSVLGDRFGAALAADGSRLIVGAPYEQSETGAVYVYEQASNGDWELHSKIAGTTPGARFGQSVDIGPSTALVGAEASVTRLARSMDGAWAQKDVLPPAGTGFDYGTSVALTPQRALVGAYLEDDAPATDNGAGYLFSLLPSGSFASPERFLAPSVGSTDYFGYSVAMRPGLAVVGAYGDDDFADNGGAVYAIDTGETPLACGPGSACEPPRGLSACGTYRLAASQTADPEGDPISVAWHDFGRRALLQLPSSMHITSASAGKHASFFYKDPTRRGSVRCRFKPPAGSGCSTDWVFDGCKIPLAGVDNVGTPGAAIKAAEVRFGLGDGDFLTNGPAVSGEMDLNEAGACNAFSMDDCTVARSTAARFAGHAERFETATLPHSFHFQIPSTIPVISESGASVGQKAALTFSQGTTAVATCSYVALAGSQSVLSFSNCSPAQSPGDTINADHVVLRLLPQGFRGKQTVAARLELTPSDAECVSSTQDDDGDGIPTALELLESRKIGVADVDRDGLPNWKDSDADGDGIADSVEAGGGSGAKAAAATAPDSLVDGLADANDNGVPDFIDEACEPAIYYVDADGDGFGDPGSSTVTCPAPDGYVENGDDCNDANAAINPNATEVCGDSVDNDCDAVVDETCTPACNPAPTQGEGIILSQLQAGHGFTANSGGGSPHNLNDTSDFAIGTQSAWIETDTAGTAKTLKKSNLGTFDFTGRMPRLWVKLDDPTNASTLQLYLGNNNLADQYKFTFNSTQGQQWTTDGDWVAFSMSWSNKTLSKVGNPNRAAITDVQLRAIDTASGGSVRLHVNQFSMVDEPTAYPNGILSFTFDDGFSSVYSLGKPILDAHGFPATAYVIVDAVDTANHMTLAQLTDLQNNSSWEIAYHAYDSDIHTAGFPLTPQVDLEQDIDLGRDWLYQNGFNGYCDCAYPHGAFTGGATDVLGAVHAKLSACRTVHQKHREAYPPSDPYKMRVLLVTSPVTVATVEAAMDQAKANKEWIILVFHNLTDTPAGNDDYDPDNFESIVDYATTIGIPVQTVGQLLSLP